MTLILLSPVVLFLSTFAFAWACTANMLRGARPITEPTFLAELVHASGVRNVKFYVQEMDRQRGLVGWAVHLPFRNIVVMNQRAMLLSEPSDFMFWVAHELGHHHHGHCRRNFWRMVTLAFFFWPERSAERMIAEREADAFAEKITGISETNASKHLWV